MLRKTAGKERFEFYSLDPVKGIGEELARTAWQPSYTLDWDVSPDGKSVALPKHDTQSARIRALTLDAKPGARQEQTAELRGAANIAGLVWAADGKGWFVSIYTTLGQRMLYEELNGTVHGLAEIQGCLVPSPDGRRVAYLDTIFDSSAFELRL